MIAASDQTASSERGDVVATSSKRLEAAAWAGPDAGRGPAPIVEEPTLRGLDPDALADPSLPPPRLDAGGALDRNCFPRRQWRRRHGLRLGLVRARNPSVGPLASTPRIPTLTEMPRLPSNEEMLAWFSDHERHECEFCGEKACVSQPDATASCCLACGAVTVEGVRIDGDSRLPEQDKDTRENAARMRAGAAAQQV